MLVEYGKYALMLNAQTTKINKVILSVKPIFNNEIINCHKPKTVVDLDKVKDRSSGHDFNYINLFPHELPK